jgi:hypothetical protein
VNDNAEVWRGSVKSNHETVINCFFGWMSGSFSINIIHIPITFSCFTFKTKNCYMTQLSHFETVLLWVSCYRWKGGSCALWQIFVLNVKHEHFWGMWIIFLWWLYMVFFKFQVFINKKNQSNIDVLPALTWYYISKHR